MNNIVERFGSVQSSVEDTTGRPFLVFKERLLVPNKLPGREGTPTDMQALSEYGENQKSVIALLKYFRSHLGSEPLSLRAVTNLANGLHYLPLYLDLREINPVEPKATPPSVIDTSRIGLGIQSAVTEMLQTGYPHSSRQTSETIVGYAGGNNPRGINHYISKNRDNPESCPASTDLIIRLLELMIHKTPDASSEHTPDWEGIITVADIKRSIGFGFAYLPFDRAYTELKTLMDKPTNDLTDFQKSDLLRKCKYLASQIEDTLRQENT